MGWAQGPQPGTSLKFPGLELGPGSPGPWDPGPWNRAKGPQAHGTQGQPGRTAVGDELSSMSWEEFPAQAQPHPHTRTG